MTEIVVITRDDLSEILRQEFKIAVLDLREQLEAKHMLELMCKKELSEYLRCDISKINRYMKKGLPSEQFGKSPLFRKSSVDEWLKSNKKPQAKNL